MPFWFRGAVKLRPMRFNLEFKSPRPPSYVIIILAGIPVNWNTWYSFCMVNVNRNELSSKDLTRLLRRFDDTLANLDRNGTTVFLSELLGKEERLTIAKRLATIVLLSEGYSEYKTSRLLKLSPTTTGNIAAKIRAGTYDGLLRVLKKKKINYLELLDAIDSILHLGGLLPHRVGLDRYRGLNLIHHRRQP